MNRDSRTPPPVTYTAAEVAQKLKLSTRQVYRLCEAGILPHKKIGRTIRIPVAAFDDYLADAS